MKKTVGILLSLLLFTAIVAVAQSETPSDSQRSTSIVSIGGENYYVHTVQPKETFYSLSHLYGTDEATIVSLNPFAAGGLQVGQKLKIPAPRTSVNLSQRQMKKTFGTHTVLQGETIYSIAKRYGISVSTLMEDNPGLDPAHLSIGQEIKTRYKSEGEADPAQIKEEMVNYTEALNAVSTDFIHHLVEKNETIYGLCKKYGVTSDQLKEYNAKELESGLKVGSILKIPQELTQSTSTPQEIVPVTPPSESTPLIVDVPRSDVQIKRIDRTTPTRVVLLLPFEMEGKQNTSFLEFYQGVLLSLGELKGMGISAQLDVFNLGKGNDEAMALLREPALGQADLIVGPVYDDNFATIANFASQNGIPIVSPLGAVESADNSLIFDVAPTVATKMNKLREELSSDKNVIVISGSTNDEDFKQEVAPLLPTSTHYMNYRKEMSSEISRVLSSTSENVFVVLPSNESTVDDILARIGSVQNDLVARGVKKGEIKVVGSSRWSRFTNIDKNLFFKLNLCYITLYHADRGNERVAAFDRRFMGSFKSFPSLYSYRGYDVIKLFVGGIKLYGEDFVSHLNDGDMPLLQTPYHFIQRESGKKYENDAWAKVCYRSDYTIEVK